MKRAASILLLFMLLFNFIGYRIFSNYLEARENALLESQLDRSDYDVSQLISIKVPITGLSYYNNSKQFERIDGGIELNGVEYKYVKLRLYNDSIELLCIPNHAVMVLRSSKEEFFKLANDLQHTGQNKKSNSHVYKNFSFEKYTLNHLFDLDHMYNHLINRISSYSAALSLRYSPVLKLPPKFPTDLDLI